MQDSSRPDLSGLISRILAQQKAAGVPAATPPVPPQAMAVPPQAMAVAPPTAAAAPQPVKIRAVLTDFDGVIGDNARLMREAYDQLKASHPHHLPDAGTALQYAEKPRAFLREQVPELTDHQKTELFSRGRKIYESMPMHMLPGAENLLQACRDSQIPLAVVSNNHCTKAHWQQLGLDKVMPGAPVFENAKKPSGGALEKALAALQQPAGRDVIMIDDNWKGLVAAAKVGVTPVYFGDKAHIVLPIVAQECKKCGIAAPEIPVVRNQEALQQMLKGGVVPQQKAATVGAAPGAASSL